MDPDKAAAELQKRTTDGVVRLSAPDSASLIGTVIAGKYEIVSFLGEGGMSSVFQAKDLVINRIVALKILLSLRSADQRSIIRFQKEAMAAGRLNHPNIVQLYDVGTHDDGTPYLVMDYVPGITLAQHLQVNGQLPTLDALKLFVQVADALAHAHTNGVIHRDIKPSNLLITSGPNNVDVIKILDFGIAKVWDEALSGQQATKTGEVFGSPLYMSPEQAVGTKVDHRSDIYSTGCALFEALSGLPPHVGETTISTIMKHQNDKAQSLREASLGGDFPAQLEAAVSKCLQKNPDQRYQNMTDFKLVLSSVIRNIEAGGADYKPSGRTISGKSVNTPLSQFANSSAAKPVDKTVLVVAGLMVVCFGLFAVLLWSEFFPPPPKRLEPVKSRTAAVPSDASRKTADTSILPDVLNLKDTAHVSGEDSMLPNVATYSDSKASVYDEELAQMYRERPDEAEIRLRNFIISSSGVNTLSKFKSMRKLNLTSARFNDLTPEWARLSALPLAIFSATDTKISDTGLLAITKIDSLRDLNLGSCKELTDAGLKNIPHLQVLRKFEGSEDKFTDVGLALIGQAESLTLLNLDGNSYIHGAPLAVLSKLKRLESIGFAGTAVTNASIVPIGKFPALRFLNLSNTKITDESIPTILKLKSHLRVLMLNETSITDKALKAFVMDMELSQVHVQGCPRITEAALNEVRQNASPNCTIYDDAHPRPPHKKEFSS